MTPTKQTVDEVDSVLPADPGTPSTRVIRLAPSWTGSWLGGCNAASDVGEPRPAGRLLHAASE
jgi:hypothetical protein